MEPTRILIAEHRVIETVIVCIERMVDETQNSGKLDASLAEQAIEFVRKFADGCHHAKEELRLFPAMEHKGMPRQGGPIAVMLMEHEHGRAFVKGMVENLKSASAGDPQAISDFSHNAIGYANLLKQHIHKEDHILFPMADRMMSAEDESALMKQFEEAETETGEGVHERLLSIAESLANRYGVSTEHIHHMRHHH